MTEFEPSEVSARILSKAERQAKRLERKRKEKRRVSAESGRPDVEDARDRTLQRLALNETELLKFMVQINKVYEETLHKNPPFMTWVLVGMQSSGKSTVMERILNAVINIVQEGTGTRCPLDVTCIHDEACSSPQADLCGEGLANPGTGLTVEEVFERITEHNRELDRLDRFSTNPLKLVYRASNVQSMRFVDTPGIISNISTGNDNREDIKAILRTEISKPNTKLCVLLEATEFAKNPIIDFLDQSLDGRQGWVQSAKFLMTKFDKQVEDSRTPIKANAFFNEFVKNNIYPHLLITPTLDREDLGCAELFEKRNENLAQSNDYEKIRFKAWLDQHRRFREAEGSTEVLDTKISTMIGFPVAQAAMRKEMLEHTLETLPEVIGSLEKDLGQRKSEYQDLKERQKFTDPAELKLVLNNMLHCLQERIASYLDGDLSSSLKYADRLQTLEDEIYEEEDSAWADRDLDHFSANEDNWRTKISEMEEIPDDIQPNMEFLGGKQVHRAIEFFRVVMIDSLPEPHKLAHLVPNAVGYGAGGLMRENWEGAARQICMTLMQDLTHPGINYLVKHIGYILRCLFHIALDDIMEGQEGSRAFRLVPNEVKDALLEEFDGMLWNLMQDAANKMHTALEPYYATIDPNLPTFMAPEEGDEFGDETDEDSEKHLVAWAKAKLSAAFSGSSSEAKKMLKDQNKARAKSKKAFLQDKRTSMITSDETKVILDRSFQYLIALMEFSLVSFRLQINCYLYEKFKTMMKRSFVHEGGKVASLVKPDPDMTERIAELEGQIKELESVLQEVQRMQRGL